MERVGRGAELALERANRWWIHSEVHPLGDSGEVGVRLPEDPGEVAAGVYRPAAHREGADRVVRVRDPVGRRVGCGFERSEVALFRVAVDDVAAPDIDRAPAHDERGDKSVR